MSKRGRKPKDYPDYRKQKLSSDTRIIQALLKKQPQKEDELCRSAKIAKSTLYNVTPLLINSKIIKKTENGYALIDYEEMEGNIVKAIEKWKDIAFRFPTIKEIVNDVGAKQEDVERLVYKTKEKTKWFEPNEGIIKNVREKLGEILVCAARIKQKYFSETDLKFMYQEDPKTIEEAERFLKGHPGMIPTLRPDGYIVVSWPDEALKYLYEPYNPKCRPIPGVGAAVVKRKDKPDDFLTRFSRYPFFKAQT